jgi:hypothetical protein
MIITTSAEGTEPIESMRSVAPETTQGEGR